MAFLKLVKSAVVGNEVAKFTLVAKHADYETRDYDESSWACLSLSGKLPEEFGRPDFQRLFSYINCENEKSLSMDMTKPVLTKVYTDETKQRDFEVSFYISPSVGTAPKASDSGIKIHKHPAQQVYVRVFSGMAKGEDWTREYECLLSKLNNKDELELSYYYRAGYDPPFKPFNRRNEIWVVKKPAVAV